MATRNTDVNLIIRAKTEGEQAISSMADAIAHLVNDAGSGSKDIAEFGRTIAALDKAAAGLAAAQDKLGGSASKQASALHAATAGIVEQQDRVETLKRGLKLLTAEAEKGFVGPRRNGLADMIRLAKSELADAERQVNRYTAAYERNLAGLQTSRSGLLELNRTTRETAEAQAEATAAVELNTQALAQQAAEAKRAAEAQQFYNERSAPGLTRGAATSQGATPDMGGALALINQVEQMEREAAHLRATLDPLAAIQEKFNTQLGRYRELAAAGKLSSEELAAAEAHLATEAEQARLALDRQGKTGKLSLFGLKPYELQNLSYQINDVVTGLASGQRVTQIIAQQGGQILQLFPQVAGNIIGALSNPAILGLVATIGVLALSMKRAADDAERLRTTTALLNFRADGRDYNAQSLADQQKTFERKGASAEDAGAAVRSFLEQSVDPAKLNDFAKAAQATADALGEKLPDAARSVAEAFTGGYDAIAKFDDKLNFLTADQREHIRALFDEGKAQQARSEALNIYIGKQQEMADKARGDWAGASRELNGAWSQFMETLANTSLVHGFTSALEGLAGAARTALNDLNNVNDASGTLQEIADKRRYIAELQAKLKANPNASDAGATRASIFDSQSGLTTLIARYNELAKAQGKVLLRPDGTLPAAPATGGTVNEDPNSPAAKLRKDELARISVEDELQRLRDAGQTRILTAAERARREELAGQQAARGAADAQVAAAERRRAIAHETATIEKEADARAKAAAAEREREIRQFEGRVIGAEGGAGKNPHGSAQGYGQFTSETFLNQFGKVFPAEARRLGGGVAPAKATDAGATQVLALRQNEQVARAIIDNYARENAKFLESFGAKVTAGNLYLAHFLGAGGAKAVLTAAPSTPVDQIINRLPRAAQVLSGNQGYLRTDGGKGRYRTAGELRTFIAGRVGDTGQAQSEAQVAINNLIEEARRKQDAFNESVRHGAEDKQDAIAAQREENVLYGAALIAAQRRKAITDAERELNQKTEDANRSLKPGETPVTVSPEQIAAAKDLAAALFDAAHAKELLNAQMAEVQRPVDELTAERDLLQQQADYMRSIGETTQADAIDKKIEDVNAKLRQAYDALIQFYQALSPEQRVELGIVDEAQLDNIIAKLKEGQQQTQQWGKVAGVSAKDIAQSFASNAASAFTNFINKVAAGKNVFKSLGEGIREFAANFIASIAQMILQLLAYAAAVTILRALGVPIPNTSAGSLHTGGVVGQGSGQRRNVSPMLFAGAMRYHTGGVVGLAPDEVPIIARKGEEVLTEGNPRHRNNAGAGASAGAAGGNTSIYNVFDENSLAEMVLRSPAGEKILINHVNENRAAYKAALG